MQKNYMEMNKYIHDERNQLFWHLMSNNYV